jgi:hypothetical protein
MIWVFDKQFHTVPDEGHICSGFYYEKTQYMSNVAGGIADDGILGHGSLFIDIFHSGSKYDTILADDITDETDLLYLVEPWPMFNGIKEKAGMEDISNPVNWHRTLEFIPENILQLARDKRLIILLHIPEFTFGLPFIKAHLRTLLRTLKITKSQFRLISGIKDKDFYYWPGFEYSQLVCYNDVDVVKSVNLKRREKKYTCLNRIDKGHRRYVAVNLWKRNLAFKGFFSYSFGKFTYEGLVKAGWDEEPRGFDPVEWDMPYHEWKRFYDTAPWTADKLTIDEHNHHWHVEKQHYEQSYWNYVTETGIEDIPFLSEKTFKPIANLQPFIKVAA